jgi:molecular chaperone DnaK
MFESEYKQKRDEIELHDQADIAVFTAEKMLKESGDKLEPEDKTKVEESAAAVKKALADDNLDEIKKSMEALTEAVYAITLKIYQMVQAEQAAQQQSAGAGAPSNPDTKVDDNVVNMDYKVFEE